MAGTARDQAGVRMTVSSPVVTARSAGKPVAPFAPVAAPHYVQTGAAAQAEFDNPWEPKIERSSLEERGNGEAREATEGNRPTHDMQWHCERPCLAVAEVEASSASGTNGAANTIDGDLRTRWSPAKAGTQWVEYDLGKVCDVRSVSMVWFALRGGETMVKIELSQDGGEYRTVDIGVLQGRGTNETLRSFLPHDARYVRIFLNSTSASSQVSLQEVGIHASVNEDRAAEAR
jgi:hypothetical protein